MNFVDLFSGIGGLSAGFEESGWTALAANDCCTRALSTYKKNFRSAKVFDFPIEELSSAEILRELGASKGELECMVGGPPCQAFSINNHRRSTEDYRASLVRHYLRLVAELQPQTILIENVPGMIRVGGERPVESVMNSLRARGYKCSAALVSGEHLGLPQTRKRIFILASRKFYPQKIWERVYGAEAKRLSNADGIERLAPSEPRTVSIYDAVSDLPAIENGGGDAEMHYSESVSLSPFQKRARKFSKTVRNHICSRLSSVNLERLSHIQAGQNWHAIPFELLPKGMQRAKKSDHTKRYGRLSWNGLAGTLLTKCDPHWGAYFHPDQDRVISVREAARIQGFRDDFEFGEGGLTSHYKGIGNSVPPMIASKIAAAIALEHKATL